MFVEMLLLCLQPLPPLLLWLLLLLLRAAAVDAREHERCEGCCVTWCGKSVWSWTAGLGSAETESTKVPGEATVKGGLQETPLELRVAVPLG